MTYEVDFAIKKNNDFTTIYSALIFADGVTECKRIASEIAQELHSTYKDIKVFVYECVV